MDNLQTLIGERIAKQRKQLRISQTELAEQLGKSLRTVQKYESGEIDMSVSVLEQIADILKMPINSLIGYDSIGNIGRCVCVLVRAESKTRPSL